MMKKITAIILALTCVFAVSACKKSGGAVENVNKMFNALSPTKVVTVVTETFDDSDVVLTSKYTLKSGKVDGKDAATYEFSEMTLRSVEEGSGDVEVLPWVETTGLYEYHEDKGVRIDGGKWQDDMYSFISEKGIGAMTLTNKLVSDFSEDKTAKTVKFTVLAANTKEVFGYEIKGDVLVNITHDGSAITGVDLSYTVPAEDKDHPDVNTVVKILYSYDAEKIDIK